SFLPFASLGILRLTTRLIPDFRFHWFGKYPIRWMALNYYRMPHYVVQRTDPAMPELDQLLLKTFFSNSDVYNYLSSFFSRAARERLESIIEGIYLNRLITQFENKRFHEANLPLMLRVVWLLTLEELT
ncbi:MAG: hypothetical protein QXD69_04365, partial [Candidatus Bathyarchaeia archaeon]